MKQNELRGIFIKINTFSQYFMATLNQKKKMFENYQLDDNIENIVLLRKSNFQKSVTKFFSGIRYHFHNTLCFTYINAVTCVENETLQGYFNIFLF